MSVVFKFLFGLLTDPLGLPVNIIVEYLILSIIEVIAYIVAFQLVGDMYDSGRISTKTGGSAAHWMIRLLLFIPVWAVAYGLIWVGKLVIAHRLVAVVCLCIAIFVGIIITLFVHNKRKGGVSNA